MSTKTFNPYAKIQEQFAGGMNDIIDNMPVPPPTPDPQKLFDVVLGFLDEMAEGDDPNVEPGLLNLLAGPFLPNAVNAYRDNNQDTWLFYNESQRMFINSLTMTIKNSSVESIEELLDDSEDKLSESGLPSADQAPIFLAIALGKASFNYWQDVIGRCDAPASSSSSSSAEKWQPYLDCDRPVNYANLPFWVCAAMDGALLGYSQVNSLNFKIPGVLNTIGVAGGTFAGLFVSVGLSAGKVIYKWVPRMGFNNTNQLNQRSISSLSDIDLNGDIGKAFPRTFWNNKCGPESVIIRELYGGGREGRAACRAGLT